MAVFGEYDLRNEFNINTAIESLIKILSITINDKTSSSDLNILFTSKLFNNTDLGTLFNGSNDNNQVIPTDTVGSNSTRTVPYVVLDKLINSLTSNYNNTVESQSVATSGDSTINDIVKIFNSVLYNHYLNNGTTLDTDTVTESDVITARDFSKALNATTLNYTGVLDDNSSLVTETSYLYAGGATRLGVSAIDLSKPISDTQLTSDTDATSATDLNRTTPAFSLVKAPIQETYSGTTDNGGSYLVNPYAEAGWFLGDGGAYVGTAIPFTG